MYGDRVRRPLHPLSTLFGPVFVWPSGIVGDLLVRKPETSGPSGIARDPRSIIARADCMEVQASYVQDHSLVKISRSLGQVRKRVGS